MKSGGSMDMIEFNRAEMCGGVKNDVWKSQITIVRSKRGFETMQVFCPFIVSIFKITQVDEIHKLFDELLKNAMLKMSHLEAILSKKLIGMKFNVEYLKSKTLEVHDYVTHGE
jgi:hypothetical protein